MSVGACKLVMGARCYATLWQGPQTWQCRMLYEVMLQQYFCGFYETALWHKAAHVRK